MTLRLASGCSGCVEGSPNSAPELDGAVNSACAKMLCSETPQFISVAEIRLGGGEEAGKASDTPERLQRSKNMNHINYFTLF